MVSQPYAAWFPNSPLRRMKEYCVFYLWMRATRNEAITNRCPQSLRIATCITRGRLMQMAFVMRSVVGPNVRNSQWRRLIDY